MIVPNEVLAYWFKMSMEAFLNGDWNMMIYVLSDLNNVVERIGQINKKKQLEGVRKAKMKRVNKFDRVVRR